jgi:glutaredoxin 3
MAKVEIYTWATCPFCIKAKALLTKKGIAFTEHKVDGDDAARGAMAKRGTDGKRSVPQVYINNQHVGGCDALHALDAAGKLDGLLMDANA